MELKFDSIEEVLEFVNRIRPVVRSVDPATFVDDLGKVARSQSKLAAIKLYRAVFGTGLKESKEAVERAPEFRSRVVVDPWGCGDPNCGVCGPSFEDTPF